MKSKSQSLPTSNDHEKQNLIKRQQKTQHQQKQQQSSKTPQFPFYRWQIYFHLIFISIIAIVITVKYQVYVVSNFQIIKSSLSRSYISQFVQGVWMRSQNLLKYENKGIQGIRPLQLSSGVKISIYRFSKDSQWQAYRNNLWLLISMALLWKFLTHLTYLCNKYILARREYTNKNTRYNLFSSTNSYICIFSFFILLFSFRADIVLYMSIILIWWVYVQIVMMIKKWKQENVFIAITIKQFNNLLIISFWIIMLITLFFNQKYQHFSVLSEWFQGFIPDSLQPLKNSHRAIHCSQLLNMTFLRLLSYGIDRVHEGDQEWQKGESKLKQKKMIRCEQCQTIKESSCPQHETTLFCYKGRDHIIKRSHSLRQYLNYALFTPVMLTGPPISYNNYFSFQELAAPKVTARQCIYHLFLIFTFELYQHIFPVITPEQSMTLIQMQIFSLLHLFFIWYKFLIIWRTAKIWAQVYGVSCIDNMSRCMFNNYGFEGFWRMWHRGFNHWLIRYLYVPLGGRYNLFSVLAVIVFVAFWHDHTINIIFWALIIALFMIPQIVIKRYFRTGQKHLFKRHWFKYFSAFVSAIYIYFLIICNIIGFGYGIGKLQLVLNKITSNIPELIWSIIVIMSACMLMFYKRNMENNSKNY